MGLSVEARASREFFGRKSVAAVFGLGMFALFVTGCASHDRGGVDAYVSPSPSASVAVVDGSGCGPLELVRFIGGGKEGVNAVNAGSCVAVHETNDILDSRVLDQIPGEAPMLIECYDLTRSSIQVKTGKRLGYVGLGETAAQQFDDDPVGNSVPPCVLRPEPTPLDSPTPTPSAT